MSRDQRARDGDQGHGQASGQAAGAAGSDAIAQGKAQPDSKSAADCAGRLAALDDPFGLHLPRIRSAATRDPAADPVRIRSAGP